MHIYFNDGWKMAVMKMEWLRYHCSEYCTYIKGGDGERSEIYLLPVEGFEHFVRENSSDAEILDLDNTNLDIRIIR